MKKRLMILSAFLALMIFAGHSRAEMKSPMLLVTAEYTDYERLWQPDIVEGLKKYGVAICVCVREDQLNDKLDRLYTIYAEAGVPILFWPMLPLKDGLYLNKGTTSIYLEYLDVLFGWAESHGHRIEALVIDVEPSYIPPKPGEPPPSLLKNIIRLVKGMDDKTFQDSIPEFQKIIDKIHAHDCLAVAAVFPFVVDDRVAGDHGWEDFTGGPVATMEWDYVALMMYSSWFVEKFKGLGIDWDAAHHLLYQYALDAKRIWGERAAMAVGVTNPGQGHETLLYTSAGQIAPAVAAVRAAGIENIGIYDMKGILDSGGLEPWLKTLSQTPPGLPPRGEEAATRFRRLARKVAKLLEALR